MAGSSSYLERASQILLCIFISYPFGEFLYSAPLMSFVSYPIVYPIPLVSFILPLWWVLYLTPLYILSLWWFVILFMLPLLVTFYILTLCTASTCNGDLNLSKWGPNGVWWWKGDQWGPHWDQPSAYRLTIYRYANIVWFSKYRYRIFFYHITRYLIMKYWSILAFHGPVKA